jgi:urease accessory protein
MNAVLQTVVETPARAGWRAALRLRFAADQQRTRLIERQNTGPLVVQRPFYPEGGLCHVYIVHPPGGVVGGDELELDVQAGPGVELLLTTPAAGKFYRSAGAAAQLRQQLCAEDALLEWLPQENIHYPGAIARVSTVVQLHGAARFIGWELSCFGLPASNALFDRGEVRQRFELWHGGQPLLMERPAIDAEVAAARWGLAGQVACGTLLVYPGDESLLQRVRSVAREDVTLACSVVDGVLVCRAMAARADALRALMVSLWQQLRPALAGRAALLPRIWAT